MFISDLAMLRLFAFLIANGAAFQIRAASTWKLDSDFWSLQVSLNTLFNLGQSSWAPSVGVVPYGSNLIGEPSLFRLFQTSISLILAASCLTEGSPYLINIDFELILSLILLPFMARNILF